MHLILMRWVNGERLDKDALFKAIPITRRHAPEVGVDWARVVKQLTPGSDILNLHVYLVLVIQAPRRRAQKNSVPQTSI